MFFDLPRMPGFILFLFVVLHTARSSPTSTVLTCDECLLVAKVLEVELAKLEPDRQETNELVGDVKPRRRMLHPRSEPQIYGVLDRLCSVVSTKLGQHYAAPCNRIIAQHRDALENGIYADGMEHARHLLCMDLTHACGAHDLYDSGEL